MAYTTINKSTDYFRTKLYTGNGSSRSITFDENTNMKPDFSWIKKRSASGDNLLFDAVRGVQKNLPSNSAGEEYTLSSGLTAFNTNGYSIGTDGDINANSTTYASWNWKANGQGSSNTAGSINTSYTSVNTTAGFSISKYTGTGSAATVGHGLGAVPKMFIIKDLTSSNDWQVYHNASGNNNKLHINNTNAATGTNNFATTTPTSSVFSISQGGQVNTSNSNYIALSFAEKIGYSKFGSYKGNGNADGAFIYTGFKPTFVMTKRSDNSTGGNWQLYDNKRLGYNSASRYVNPNLNNAEDGSSNNLMDIYSNGFKLRSANQNININNGSYIYMAFGQSLVGTNNVPCTAR